MKKLFLMIAFAMILCATTVNAKSVNATLPSFDVSFNGQAIENEHRQYPLLVYKDITYVPMTYYDCRYLGLNTYWDNDTKTLYIDNENITCYYREDTLKNANKNKVVPTVCNFNVVVNGKKIDNLSEEYPLLTFRDITYLPLTWRFAVEEFGWNYYFDSENGLVINSSNYHIETVNLPNASGSAAFDGKYYYYNGKSGENSVVYAAFHETPNNAYIIHQLPSTPLAQSVTFKKGSDGVYIEYISGHSPIMSSRLFYKLCGNARTVEEEKPDTYEYLSHGYSQFGVRNTEISVLCENPYFDSATKISYTKNGQTYEMPALPGRVAVGCTVINGQTYSGISASDCVKIFEDKIYFMAYDHESEDKQSGIYAIDTNTNTVEKIIDAADGAFHVYNSYSAMNPGSPTTIIYGKDGSLYSYIEAAGKSKLIYDGSQNTDMVLSAATGEYNVYVSMKTLYGTKTSVMSLGAYAGGPVDYLFSANTATTVFAQDGKLIAYTNSESPEDKVRLIAVGCNEASGNAVDFRTSDVCSGVFVSDNYLIYSCDGKTVRVNLE